jgi:hypothetical protein
LNGITQNVPHIGKDDQLEIANWNLYWFGKTQTGYGPSDDALQMKLIQSVIYKSDIDIWAFSELSNSDSFQSLVSKLPNYQGIISDAFPEQKTGLIFKSSMFQLASSRSIGTQNKDSFTTSRFPLEVCLVPIIDIGIDSLFLIVLHLKANFGNDSLKTLAYNSRKRSSEWLKMELNKSYLNRFCIVLGDWNDDIDKSIFNGLPSPFVNLQDLDFSYFFNSKKLSENNSSSTTSYPDIIDHQLISNLLRKKYKEDSTFVFRLDAYISEYAKTCSDHYPVYSVYNTFRTDLIKFTNETHLKLFPNPTERHIQIEHMLEPCTIQIFNNLGLKLFEKSEYFGERLDCQNFRNGSYHIRLLGGKSTKNFHFQIIH